LHLHACRHTACRIIPRYTLPACCAALRVLRRRCAPHRFCVLTACRYTFPLIPPLLHAIPFAVTWVLGWTWWAHARRTPLTPPARRLWMPGAPPTGSYLPACAYCLPPYHCGCTHYAPPFFSLDAAVPASPVRSHTTATCAARACAACLPAFAAGIPLPRFWMPAVLPTDFYAAHICLNTSPVDPTTYLPPACAALVRLRSCLVCRRSPRTVTAPCCLAARDYRHKLPASPPACICLPAAACSCALPWNRLPGCCHVVLPACLTDSAAYHWIRLPGLPASCCTYIYGLACLSPACPLTLACYMPLLFHCHYTDAVPATILTLPAAYIPNLCSPACLILLPSRLPLMHCRPHAPQITCRYRLSTQRTAA